MVKARFKVFVLILAISFCSFSLAKGKGTCDGHMINPLKDICWRCLFPLSIGSAELASGNNPDTENPSNPFQACPMGIGWRYGLAIGYWEPFAVTDVTKTPYCLINMGGKQLNINKGQIRGATEAPLSGTEGAFYQVHWYKYPLIMWLNIISSTYCMQRGDYDIAYMSELDPTWDDDQSDLLLTPEVAIFANPVAQLSCLADAIAATTGSAINSLFWCMGAQGSSYPLTGNVSDEFSTLQNSTLLTERMDFKLHRLGIVPDSIGVNTAVCYEHNDLILPKNRYRYEMTNPKPDANSCHPFGHTVTTWQTGKLSPNDAGNYGYLVWRKRNCVYL